MIGQYLVTALGWKACIRNVSNIEFVVQVLNPRFNNPVNPGVPCPRPLLSPVPRWPLMRSGVFVVDRRRTSTPEKQICHRIQNNGRAARGLWMSLGLARSVAPGKSAHKQATNWPQIAGALTPIVNLRRCLKPSITRRTQCPPRQLPRRHVTDVKWRWEVRRGVQV